MSATSADDNLIGSIQNQLEGLKKTPDGLFLYRLIDRGLQKRSGNYTGDTGRDFVNFLHGLLQRYATNPDGDTVTRVKVRLLQQRLAPHMMDEASSTPESTDDDVQNDQDSDSQNTLKAADLIDALDQDQPDSDSVDNTPEQTHDDIDSSKKAFPAPEAIEIEGLDFDETAFDVSDDSLKDIEFLDNDEEEVDFPDATIEFPDSTHSEAAKTSEEEIADDDLGASETGASEDNPVDEKQAASVDLDDAESRHEIEIDISDDLGISPPVDLAGDDQNDATKGRSTLFETIDEPEEGSEPVEFGDEFSLDFPKSEPDIIVGEVVDSKAADENLPTPEKKNKPLPAAPSARSEDIHDASRERVDRLHETFASKLADSISRNEDYTTLLRSNLKVLKLADSPNDVLDIKHLLIMGLEDLLQGNETLNKNLGATNHYLKISQLDRNLLKDELGRVRDQSLVDELTGMQNQKAFNKQIAAEIGRSKRYGFSLALSLVVLDDFDQFRDTLGNDTADEVLRTFANQILSGFRGYDAVARLKDHQFGILFPNTQKEGALSALEKAQKRAADTIIQHNGKSLRLPTFTSSLTLYSPGDQPEAILKRNYDALALAGENTRDKIIVALPQT